MLLKSPTTSSSRVLLRGQWFYGMPILSRVCDIRVNMPILTIPVICSLYRVLIFVLLV